MMTVVLKAASFAARKHRYQKRKDEGASPYINHPIEVARIISEIGHVADAGVLAAALLHDTWLSKSLVSRCSRRPSPASSMTSAMALPTSPKLSRWSSQA